MDVVADWKDVRECATIVLATFGFAAGLYQYRRAQLWKRAEWLAAEMRCFFDDPKISNALYMLDWNSRRLPLLLTAFPDSHPRAFDYSVDQLPHALTSRTNPQSRPYGDEEICIRDCFDRLFDGLERLESFIRADLIRHGDLVPYLGYWIGMLGNKQNGRKPPAIMERLWTYIADYGFSGVQSLLLRFGHDVRVDHSLPDVAKLNDDIRAAE